MKDIFKEKNKTPKVLYHWIDCLSGPTSKNEPESTILKLILSQESQDTLVHSLNSLGPGPCLYQDTNEEGNKVKTAT